MAQLNKNKSISGTIGNIVFREVDKKQILQAKPGPIKQTQETKASGSEFRQCSRWAKWLRLGLTSFLANHTDHYMYSRLAGQLYTSLQTNTALAKGVRTPLNSNMDSLGGFEFNTHSPFSEYFIPNITAILNDQNQVIITVPSFNPKTGMRFAKDTEKAELLLYVMATNFDHTSGYKDGYTILPIEKKEGTVAETVWTTPILPEGHLILVCAKLLYYNTTKFTEKNYVNSKECSPAMIIGVGH